MGANDSHPIAFTLAKYRFTFRPMGVMHLPPYKGATLRGGFGYAFKDLVCIKPDRHCETCLIQDHCRYFQIFETPVPKGATMMRKYPRAPHPFVLTPPLDERTEFSEKEELSFELVLIGRAVDYLPYFIYTFEELGRRGIGREHSKFVLLRVESFSAISPGVNGSSTSQWSPVYSNITKKLSNQDIATISFSDIQNSSLIVHRSLQFTRLTLHFLTPVRITTNERLDHDLAFINFMKALLRRIQLLQYFHCDSFGSQSSRGDRITEACPGSTGACSEEDPGGSLTLAEVRRLLKLSESVEIHKSNMRFKDLTRFSTRQKRSTSISGFTGAITYGFPTNELLRDFLFYLQLGSLIHAGKHTSFGLGKYELKLGL